MSLIRAQNSCGTYTGDAVPDRFYDTLAALKIPNKDLFSSNPSFIKASSNLQHILEICQAGPAIPAVSEEETKLLLERLRPDVKDFYSISARHYLAAGAAGISHFTSLLNILISNTNLFAIPEVNSSRSWRCISTCPLLAKALDLRVADLQRNNWSAASAPTKFMAPGSSHELAALLLTESILYATATLNIPLWVLLLDKKAAFDSILKEPVMSAAFSAANHQGDHSVLYMAKRLSSRLTYLEQDKVMMGPIHDKVGVEQGGVASSDMFQLVNNNKLVVTNNSGLGLDMGAISVAAIGQADDVALLSPHP